ncbi:DNA RNA helicase domain containing protein, partial [Trichostrongylus colubriformis]
MIKNMKDEHDAPIRFHFAKTCLIEVAMLVPRTPLVDQQKHRFHKYVRGRYYVEGFHGSGLKGASRRDIVLACDIVVMTPQILLNMLKSIRQDERLYVCDFSLLIFDEVHHCTKDHPYNILMQTIHDYQGPKPQTMGLTASLGAGMVLTEDGGMKAIYEL